MRNQWHIALFAGLADRFAARTLEPGWPETSMTAGQLKAKLMAMYPEHADVIASAFVACNQEYAHDDAVVHRHDELALLPPVSGGSGEEAQPETGRKLYEIVDGPIDVAGVLARVAHPNHGAQIAFVGTTREWTADRRTIRLEYEAYVPMAEAAMRRIGEEIGERWPGTLAAIVHRIGTVAIGEASVVIAVSSAHRAEAYDASRYAIERLKQVVPVWKKEIFEDGSEWKGCQTGPWNPLSPIR